MSSKKTAASIFKDERLKQGLTQAALAKKSGIGINTYAKIERRMHEASYPSLVALSGALGIKLDEVLKVWPQPIKK